MTYKCSASYIHFTYFIIVCIQLHHDLKPFSLAHLSSIYAYVHNPELFIKIIKMGFKKNLNLLFDLRPPKSLGSFYILPIKLYATMDYGEFTAAKCRTYDGMTYLQMNYNFSIPFRTWLY